MLLDLKSLQIENFRCFASEQKIDFQKITILTGANSSGKSSILHGILGAIQSREMPFKFSPNGKYVQMGDFEEISNKHNPKNKIKISFEFNSQQEKVKYNLTTIWSKNPKTFLPELSSLVVNATEFKLSLVNNDSEGYLLDLSYDPANDPTASETEKKRLLERSITSYKTANFPQKRNNKANDEKELALFIKMIESFHKKTNIRKLKIPDIDKIHEVVRVKRNLRLNYIIDLLPEIFSSFDAAFNVISSFRLHPSRTYLEASRDRSKVDKFGDGYLDQIMIWEKKNPNKFRELQSIMQKLSLIHNIKSNRIKGGRYEIHLNIHKDGADTALPDVGFGISQFLPIIVADLQLPNNSTLMVAEPEIHLHPNVQANFANYLVEQVNQKRKNYIIETHSEYFLNRIRLAIVKGDLKESDLAIYFLENHGTDVKVHPLYFGKKGEINGAPQGFFDTYLMDVRDIALNI